MIIKRTLENKLKQMAKSFPSVAVLGPRQSGKTTLVKKSFPKKPYVLLEDPDTQEFAQKDPRAFLSNYPEGAILDEIQRVPYLFSYFQGKCKHGSKHLGAVCKTAPALILSIQT